ncbi:hypothetical protein SUGI_0788350 [Cryptomeria japonica]|uniref:uncharacterized protein LOC131028915 n=1 Tax=Cryptomeria japonica TaxID=3369 RepID=UPI002414A15C|nr:uncharacterized protein LOC131028915 [Cryptomeria japonica]GLJ38676.1 hypothetical protein SUGI_0788350 [Cryptomeria japonica]
MEPTSAVLTDPLLNISPDNGGSSLSDVVLEGLNRSMKAGRRERTKVAEQLRRNQLKQLYAKLESLIPPAIQKVERTGLVEESCNYIKKLHDQIWQLKQYREHLSAKKNTVKEDAELIEVGVEIGRETLVITISSTRRPRCFWKIVEEVEEHGLDVNMSQLSTSESFVFVCFGANFSQNMKEHDPLQLQFSLKRKLISVY